MIANFAKVKRLIAISFLFTFLSASTAFGELLKLPLLVHHFIVHEKLENKVSFIDFLNEHYTNTAQHRDYDHHHHDNLPFKTTDKHLIQIVSDIPMVSFKLEKKEYFSNKLKRPFAIADNYSNNYLNKIWQPPRQG